MGNSPSQQSIDFLMDNYTFVGEQNRIKILIDKTTEQNFALKQQCFINRAQYDRNFKRLTQRNNSNECENIISLVKIWSKQHNGICSNLFKIFTVYQYPKVKLIDQIQARSKEHKYFQEGQLYSILQSCLNAVQFEQKFVNISPKIIFILPEGVLKLIHHDLVDPNYRTMYNQNYYYAPEKIGCFHNENQNEEEIQKQTVFSLAMTLLHSATLKSPLSCYELSSKKFNRRKLQYFLNQVKNLYSSSFCELLSQMLNINPYQRIDMCSVQNSVTGFLNSSRASKNKSYENDRSNKIDQSIKMATVIPNNNRVQDFSLIYSGDTFVKGNQSQLALMSVPKKKTQYGFNYELSNHHQDLPRNHSILQRTKKTKQKQNNDKQNLYTDPKILTLIRSGIDKISKSHEPSFHVLNPYNPTAYSSQNSHQKLVVPGDKDPFSEYELTTENKDKCMFIVQTYEDKSHFQGMMMNGMKNGYGKIVYADGVYYQGNFKNDTLQGKGSLFYGPQRPAYTGDWINNKFHGKGVLYNQFPTPLENTFCFKDFNKLGDSWIKYEGEFKEDVKEGHGKIIMTNGETMEGDFVNGLINGEGVFIDREGKKIQGIWKNNIME